MQERRLYSRILYQTQIFISQEDKNWSSKLIDLSLKGVLTETPVQWQTSEKKLYKAKIQLQGSTLIIEMELKLVNEADERLHFSIEHIDIDSVSHLKRLVQLNVGNEELLHRELAQLIN